MGVAAMGTEAAIGRAGRRQHAYGYGLLPDAKVYCHADIAMLILVLDSFLDTSNPKHALI
jgi:hypothetical protein